MEMLMEHEHSAKNYVPMPMEVETKVFSCKQCPCEFSNDVELAVNNNFNLNCFRLRRLFSFLHLFPTDTHTIS